MSLFRWDSGFMAEISHIVDYILLNLLTVVCCIPIVTIGAALTARAYVAMKLTRGEEPSVWKAFFKSFQENFRQATLLWGIAALVIGLLSLDCYIISQDPQGMGSSFFHILLLVFFVLSLLTIMAVFPFIARFQVTIKEAIKGAVLFSLIHLPRMLLALLLVVVPYFVALWYLEWFLGIWLLMTTVELYYNSRMFVKGFEKLEG